MMSAIPKMTDKDLHLKNWGQNQQASPRQQQKLHPSTPLQSPYYASSPAIPRIFPTAANPSIPIPAGRIVDDSSRGILFWEVGDSKESKYKNNDATTQKNNDDDDDTITANNWTVPFKVQWLSPPNVTVPFYKVRALRNPYNKNKFLKIARDGTEIEPTVGRKLVNMFHE